MCHIFPCIVLHVLIRYSSDSVVSLFALEVSSRIPYLPHMIESTMCSTAFVVICDARPRPRIVVARISGHLADPTGPTISVTNIRMMYSSDSVVSLIALEVSSRVHHLPHHIRVYMPCWSEQPVTFISFARHRPSHFLDEELPDSEEEVRHNGVGSALLQSHLSMHAMQSDPMGPSSGSMSVECSRTWKQVCSSDKFLSDVRACVSCGHG